MLRRVGGSVIASLLLWLAAIAAVTSATPRSRPSFAVAASEAPSGLVARTVCVERATISIGAPTVERGASHARWSAGALTCAAHAEASYVRALAVLLERPRGHVPRALRRTYDAHAPPGSIDRA